MGIATEEGQPLSCNASQLPLFLLQHKCSICNIFGDHLSNIYQLASFPTMAPGPWPTLRTPIQRQQENASGNSVVKLISTTAWNNGHDFSATIYHTTAGKGYFAECELRNAESCQRVICRKFDADFFCGMKGKVRNESIRNVTEMNICKILVLAVN